MADHNFKKPDEHDIKKVKKKNKKIYVEKFIGYCINIARDKKHSFHSGKGVNPVGGKFQVFLFFFIMYHTKKFIVNKQKALGKSY